MESRNSAAPRDPLSARAADADRALDEPFGVYVHFPYCLKKCPYCDFVSYKTERPQIPHAAYADAVIAELETRGDELSGRRLETIFFGGGTPSLWAPRDLGRVLSAVARRYEASVDALEITVECNPTSLDEAGARALRAEGVNRLSVGVQALDRERLAFLGRLHDEHEGLRALEAALASGMPRVSGDLIFGVAGGAAPQRPEEAAREADRVAATGVTHVSAYALTIEPGTQFGELARKGRLPIAPDDLVVDTFFAIEAALADRGLAHYETSNYAAPGAEARHNLGYWRGHDYLGLGCGAYGTASRRDGSAERRRNFTDPARYLRAALEGLPCAQEVEPLDPETRLRERIMLGLRLEVGVDLEEAARPLGVDPLPPSRLRALERLAADGRIVREGGRVRVPPQHRALVDGIAAALF
jgi:oxygen-independent coproporphyrinogen-3 oxidase